MDVDEPGCPTAAHGRVGDGRWPGPRTLAAAIAERVVRTLRNDCLDHLIPLNEAHLRAVLTEYAASYNAERPHLSLHLEPPVPRAPTGSGAVRAQPVLGGLHHAYRRAA